jgi:exodeoxyribonuclease VII small subunit
METKIATPTMSDTETLRQLAATGEFEAVKEGLERCVELLEQGGLTLSESVDYYELGLLLSARCQTLLRDAELRISVLEQSEDLGVSAP